MWANQLADRSTVTHYSGTDHPEDAKLRWLRHFPPAASLMELSARTHEGGSYDGIPCDQAEGS